MSSKSPNRILALDVMRGITIVGMIIFNTCSGFHYAPLYHAPWIGLTLADMAFPFFMFIMGMTTYLSLSKYNFALKWSTFQKILVRTLGIILVCYAFDWLGSFLYGICGGGSFLDSLNHFDSMRYTGVLVRLGLCYGVCALAALVLRHKWFPIVIITILVLYFIMLLNGNGFERDETNILGIWDRTILGENHMCNDGGIDPEGILSTIPSIAHTMLGFWVGYKLFANRAKGATIQNAADKRTFLFVLGSVLVMCGFLFGYACPISKKIWSPSFVMITCGFGSLLLALLIHAIDINRKGGLWSNYFKVFGANPLFLYLLSEGILWPLEIIKVGSGEEQKDLWGCIFFDMLVPVFGTYGGDLVFALLNVMFCWLVGWFLLKKKIFIKL